MADEMVMGEADVIHKDGQVCGALWAADGHRPGLVTALSCAGYTVDSPDAFDMQEIVFSECSTDSEQAHRPCLIATAVGVASDVAQELSLPSAAALSSIVERGYTSEQEARAVLTAWAAEVRSAPGADEDSLGWADVVVSEVFTQEPDTARES